MDEDIDPYNIEQVNWAVVTRTTKDDYVFSEGPGSQLNPMSGLSHGQDVPDNNGVCSRVGIDATIPLRGDKWGNRKTLLDPCSMPLDQVDLNKYLETPEMKKPLATQAQINV